MKLVAHSKNIAVGLAALILYVMKQELRKKGTE
jgi:hypothetical protein